jgi:hypothetical protein
MPLPRGFMLPPRASTSTTLGLLLLAATAGLSSAQAQKLSPAPLPGLWETDWKMTVNGQDMGALIRQAMQEALQQMPPGQRAQAEQMMKAQGGPMAIGGKQQECLSPADAAKATDPQRVLADMQEDAPQCRFQPVSVTGSTMRFKGRCEDADGFTGDIAGEFTLISDKAWTGRWGGQGRMAGAEDMPGLKPGAGGQVDYRMSGNGRWLAAACGAVKPR